MTEQQIEQIKRDRDKLEKRLLKLANIIASRKWLGQRTNESTFLNEKSLHVEFLSVRENLCSSILFLTGLFFPKEDGDGLARF